MAQVVPDLPAEVWEKLGRLPFKPASPELSAERTLKAPLMPAKGKGDTDEIREDSLAEAAQALSFVGRKTETATVPFPTLTVQLICHMSVPKYRSPKSPMPGIM
jgi:hypothetical protein